MAMKLLSTPQGTSKQSLDQATQERHILELDSLIKQKRKELDELDRSQLRIASESTTKNFTEEQEWKQKITALTIEVDALESRKRSALVPLQEREKQVETKERVLLEREIQVNLKASDNDYTAEILTNRLDEVSERERAATDLSRLLTAREVTITAKEREVESRMNAVTSTMKKAIEDIEEAKAELSQEKAVLKGRDTAITERERLVALQEAGFSNREKKITDQYHALQRAITETNLKHGTQFNRNPRSE